jgi:hypothetical protein
MGDLMGLTQEHELHRRRLGRNIGLGAVLGGFVILVYALTVVKVSNLPHGPAPGAAAMESKPEAGQ